MQVSKPVVQKDSGNNEQQKAVKQRWEMDRKEEPRVML